MSKQEVKKPSRVTVKKKQWYKIIAPKSMGSKELGETYLASPEPAIGRTLKINLRELTGNPRDQSMYVGFTITGVQGTSLLTKPISYEVMPSTIRRMVRNEVNRLDDYLEAITKDGKRIVYKIFMVTISKVQRSAQAKMRQQLREQLLEESKVDFEALLANIMAHKVETNLKKKLNKVHPLREAVIRVFQLVGEGVAPAVPAVEAAVPVSAAEATAPQMAPELAPESAGQAAEIAEAPLA